MNRLELEQLTAVDLGASVLQRTAYTMGLTTVGSELPVAPRKAREVAPKCGRDPFKGERASESEEPTNDGG